MKKNEKVKEEKVEQKDILQGLANNVNITAYMLEKGLLKEAEMFWIYVRSKNLANKFHNGQDVALENYLYNLMNVSNLGKVASDLKEEVYGGE